MTFDIGAVRNGRCPPLDDVWLAFGPLPVIAQSTDADVRILAATAFVGPLVDVLPLLVQLEEVCPAEPLLTYVARKRLFSRVEAAQMLIQARGLIKTLAANVAFKRMFTRVNTKMRLEARLFDEPPLADAAPVRLLSRVRHVVPFQAEQLRETIAANLAHVRSFARVRPHMTIKVAPMAESPCAKVALVVKFSVLPLHCVR